MSTNLDNITFIKILAVDTPRNRNKSLCFQLLVQLPDELIGIGLGYIQFLRHIIGTDNFLAAFRFARAGTPFP